MRPFWAWWNGLPEAYRTAIIAGLVASVGWILTKAIPATIRVIVSYHKKRHDRRIELLSHRVWGFVKQEAGAATSAIQLAFIVSRLNISEREAKEALRLLQTKGLLWTNFDESLWFSDAKGRFFN